jgi:cell division protein FtsI (penicillin-binding protein 3)
MRGPSARKQQRAGSGRTTRRRLVVVLVVMSLLFGAVVGRLVQLQVVGSQRYVDLGESQRVRPITLAAARGTVFDRNGYDLALSIDQRTVWADPNQVTNAAAEAAQLAPVLGLDAATVAAKLGARSSFEYLARQVPDDVAKGVEDLALPGVFFMQEPKRFNPAGDLARAVLGSVNVDDRGSSGVELQYDDLLTGTPGQLVYERDPSGRTIPAGEHQLEPATPGDDIVLTIDKALQYETEQALGHQITVMGAHGGIAIVSDPRTGEILSVANMVVPEGGGPAVESSNNQSLTTVFEPGSAAKVVTMAAALEEGVATPQSVLTVPDQLQVSDHLFHDHDPHAVERLSPTDIMTTSSNIGTILLGEQLGKERLDEYLRKFGFGARTDLGFPNESAGLMLPLDKWSGTSIGSIPIGQGVAVTAMQMLFAYNVIANGGVYVAPKMVAATVDSRGRSHPSAASEHHRVISEQTAHWVRDMMTEVVRAGTGKQATIAGYTVAGKTGTARKPLATGGYQDGAGNYHYVATFAGFVPAEDPQLSVIVVLDEPTATIFASAASAPVFAEIAKYGLRQQRIPPPARPLVLSVPGATVSERDAPVGGANHGPVTQPQTAATPTTSTTVAPSTPSTGPP